MTYAVVWFAVGGLLLGGAISFRMQRKPWWETIVLVALAAGAIWFAFANLEAAKALPR